MEGIYLGVGANLNPARNIEATLIKLARQVDVRACSTFYETAPFDRPGQPVFYNGVVEIATSLEPGDLKRDVLRKIEADLGRIRGADKSAARPIDLDILIYGERVCAEEGLSIPDPDIDRRPFLAVPLYELAPDLIMPGTGRALRDIVKAMDANDMKSLTEFSERMRALQTERD